MVFEIIFHLLHACVYILQLEIPSNDTTYWCSVKYLPDEIRQQEKYIYKVCYIIIIIKKIIICITGN